MGISDNTLIRDGLSQLQRRLPPGWRLSELRAPSSVDAVVMLKAPDRSTGRIVLEAKARLDPKGAQALAAALQQGRLPGPVVVLSRYLSAATRQQLRERALGYLDLTGNSWIVVSKPGLYIETEGASEDPERQERSARSLRGPKAGRIVRELVDRKNPPGVRELAAATGIDAGYISRVLAFLDTQALVTRGERGRITNVDWVALLRRWAEEAPLETRAQLRTYLDPRGPTALAGKLAKSDERYAITGALAAAKFAPAAPARLAVVWIHDATEASARLGLRPAEAGANVMLLEPNDEGAFEGASQRESTWYVAPSQAVADLLTSPGRGPAEADELINWMRANEEVWRR